MVRFSAFTLALCLAVAGLSAVQAQDVDIMGGTKEENIRLFSEVLAVKKFAPLLPPVLNGGGNIVVAADGSGNYRSVQSAVDAASEGATITIKGGTYNERVMITQNGLKLVGENNPTISCDSKARDYGGDTRKASCVAIFGDNLVVQGITFLNTYGWTNGEKGAQAPALLVMSDKTAFYNCKIIGHQDTLFALSGRQYYSGCFIEGTVDFIFGNAKALFEGCTLSVKNNEDNHKASLTAHYRQSSSEDTGYVFLKCTIQGTLLYKKRSPMLGRTWGPYAQVVFAYCNFQIPIEPEGWSLMKQSPKKYTKGASFFEFQNTYLPGTSFDMRVSWSSRTLTAGQQSTFLGKQWVNNFV